MNVKLKLLTQTYLDFLQEREWNEPTQNPDTFNMKIYADLLAKLTSNDKIKDMRHALQPSMYNIYIKNSLGDYKGRPNTANSKTIKHIGLKQFEDDEARLKKIIDYLDNLDIEDPLGKLKITKKSAIPKDAPNSKVRMFHNLDMQDYEDNGDDSGGDNGDGGGE
jgi:hypothetical protein